MFHISSLCVCSIVRYSVEYCMARSTISGSGIRCFVDRDCYLLCAVEYNVHSVAIW